MIVVSAFRSVPPFAQGLVRDLRVRWALEEAGLQYEQKLLADGEKETAGYRAWQPFGQVPAYEEDGLKLFESGAIVLHLAGRTEAGDSLLPADPGARARAAEWMFAALNTIEPPIQNLAAIDLFYADEDWAKARRPGAEEMVQKRLVGQAGLADYLARCEARPAFGRALDAQMAAFADWSLSRRRRRLHRPRRRRCRHHHRCRRRLHPSRRTRRPRRNRRPRR